MKLSAVAALVLVASASAPVARASCNFRETEVTIYRSGPGTLTRLPGTAINGSVIECVLRGTAMSFSAATNPGAVFNGWSGGACSGMSSTCSITTVGTRMTISATFRNPQIQVQLASGVSGQVKSDPEGIFCGHGGSACTA
jgi:hypothetical protein